ncbi:hypothetical protein AVEN_124729-1 [Araneus ventricosus]|uniref:Uncharacterized protein n=1 Tax=Araneus ventricosus TaxID=182803 RepID=A0A4Y2PW84_ARAVE|nr:hypothetical protein AVEN_124729-1 [Araneus ventricosus]
MFETLFHRHMRGGAEEHEDYLWIGLINLNHDQIMSATPESAPFLQSSVPYQGGHEQQIFNGIGFRTKNLRVPKKIPYHRTTEASVNRRE